MWVYFRLKWVTALLLIEGFGKLFFKHSNESKSDDSCHVGFSTKHLRCKPAASCQQLFCASEMAPTNTSSKQVEREWLWNLSVAVVVAVAVVAAAVVVVAVAFIVAAVHVDKKISGSSKKSTIWSVPFLEVLSCGHSQTVANCPLIPKALMQQSYGQCLEGC